MRYKHMALIPGPIITLNINRSGLYKISFTDEKVMAVVNDFLNGPEGYELIEVIKHHGADATAIAFLVGIPFKKEERNVQ